MRYVLRAIRLFACGLLLTTGWSARGADPVRPLPAGAVVGLGDDRLRQPEGALCAAFSPDGSVLATGCRFNIRLWDTTSGECVRELAGGPERLAFSPDGARLLSVDEFRGALRVWNLDTGEEVFGSAESAADRRQAGEVSAVAFAPDGLMFATGSDRGTVFLWDAASVRIVGQLVPGDGRQRIDSLTYSPDGRLLAAGCQEAIQIWNARTGEQTVRIEPAHGDAVESLAFSPDGRLLYSSGRRYEPERQCSVAELKAWDVDSGKLDRDYPVAGTELLYRSAHIVSSVDGRVVVASGGDSTWIWDSAAGSLERAVTDIPAIWGAVSADGRLAASVGKDNVRLWDLRSGREVLSRPDVHGSMVRAVGWSPDGTCVATAAWDGDVRIWDATDGRHLRRLKFVENCLTITAIAFSGDGQVLLAGGHYVDPAVRRSVGAVKLWEAETGRPLKVITPHGVSNPWRVALSPDAKRIAVTVDSGDPHGGTARSAPVVAPSGTIQIIEAATGRLVRTIQGDTSVVQALSFSADGRRLWAASRDGTIRGWDLTADDKKEVFKSPDSITAAVFLPGQDRAVSDSGWRTGWLSVWNFAAEPGVEYRSTGIGVSDFPYALAVSSDGRLVAGGNRKHELCILDPVSGRELLRFPDAGRGALSVAFSPDGTRLLSGFDDGTALIWNLGPAYEKLGQ